MLWIFAILLVVVIVGPYLESRPISDDEPVRRARAERNE